MFIRLVTQKRLIIFPWFLSNDKDSKFFSRESFTDIALHNDGGRFKVKVELLDAEEGMQMIDYTYIFLKITNRTEFF